MGDSLPAFGTDYLGDIYAIAVHDAGDAEDPTANIDVQNLLESLYRQR